MVKTKFFKIACLMSAATMLATCINSGTMAKYTSSGTASGLKLTVANWNVLVNGEELKEGVPIELDGVEWTIKPTDDVTVDIPANDTIAPGTWGYAEIPVENNSDVDAKIIVNGLDTFLPSEVGSDGLSFGVFINNEPPSSFSDSLSEGDVEGTVERKSPTYIYVCYQWLFNDYDTQDTEMGQNPDTYSINFDSPLTITAEQAQSA